MKEIVEALKPFSLSPIPAPKHQAPDSLITKILGIREVSDLGILTDSLFGTTDRALVHRSWGLLGGPNNYGPNFKFSEYAKSRNYLTAILFHFVFTIGIAAIFVPFVRSIAKKFVYAPGGGPTEEEFKNDRFEYRGVGIPDLDKPTSSKAFGRAKWEGSFYVRKYALLLNR